VPSRRVWALIATAADNAWTRADPEFFRTGGAVGDAHNASAVTPGSTRRDHSTSAQVQRSIIASVIEDRSRMVVVVTSYPLEHIHKAAGLVGAEHTHVLLTHRNVIAGRDQGRPELRHVSDRCIRPHRSKIWIWIAPESFHVDIELWCAGHVIPSRSV
jgi:hypothetical protein